MVKKEHIVRYSLEEIRDLIARGDDRTDWDKVDRKTEAELESAIATDPDAEIGEPTEMWVRVPAGYEVRIVKKSA